MFWPIFLTIKIYSKIFNSWSILRGSTVLHRLFRINQRYVNNVLIIYTAVYSLLLVYIIILYKNIPEFSEYSKQAHFNN